jgi:hypothetical protein
MKRWSVVVLVAGLMIGGCDRSGSGSKRLTAEVDYPVTHFDLQAQVAADQTDGALRQLAARIADLDGVTVAEADYAGRVVRVGLLPTAAGPEAERVQAAVRSLAGVTRVGPAG